MWKERSRVGMFAIDTFEAVSALAGGLALAAGVDMLPKSWLAGTPFATYLVPGLILALVVGGSAVVAAIVTLRSRSAGAYASVVAGAITMGWIICEMIILTQFSWLQVFYFGVGAAMTVLGLRVGRHEWAAVLERVEQRLGFGARGHLAHHG